MTRREHFPCPFVLICVCLMLWNLIASPLSHAAVTCESHEDCTQVFHMDGSECVNRICTNPFHDGGCLHRMLPGWTRLRTCNSEDPPLAAQMGYCQPSKMGYPEVRIANQNWESAMFGAWIQQILLSEILDIPVTIESGSPNFNSNLYDVEFSFGYGTSYDFDALKTGYEIGDCTIAKVSSPHEYKACSHLISENWLGRIEDNLPWLKLADLGCLGSTNWFIPRFTAERDPSLASYLGLSGEKNRRKVAESFLRPISWIQYCDNISETNCLSDDGVASRRPANEAEENSFFSRGSYAGHFRPGEKNNCERYPLNCTGHIADWPCGWSYSVVQTAHHLNIAVVSDGQDPIGGYTYSQLTQIWDAANATKSNVLMLWWEPDILYQRYLGTDAEFTKVVLPPPTQRCFNEQVQGTKCDKSIETRRGESEGACSFADQVLSSIVSVAVQSMHSELSSELQSPAYEALMNYRISELQIGQILNYWMESGIDNFGFDPRWATCRWVVENIDRVMAFVPPSHPRQVELIDIRRSTLAMTALTLSSVVIAIQVFSGFALILRRNSRAIMHAQEMFIYALLSGWVLLALGSLFLALPPTDESCIVSAWLINLGFGIAFVSLCIRIRVINIGMLKTGKKLQLRPLKTGGFVGYVFLFTMLVVIYMLIWTLLDAPVRGVDYDPTDHRTEHDEFIVHERHYCSSEMKIWSRIAFSWQGLLLLNAVASLFAALAVIEDIWEEKSLVAVVGVHATLFLIRLGLAMFEQSSLSFWYESLLLSVECFVAWLVYMVPKLVDTRAGEVMSDEDPDLFICTTVVRMEIAGFTGWSSVREPVQVFRFLEAFNESFDVILEQYHLFKAESAVGCYVAAAGIPKPLADHPIVALRFAWECINKFQSLTAELEPLFGPETSNLKLRVGVHSGPVTGGYLGGGRSNFHLFGDTLYTTSQLTRTCDEGRILVSPETAKLLIEAGMKHFLEERSGDVPSNINGTMQSYWLSNLNTNVTGSPSGGDRRLQNMVLGEHGSFLGEASESDGSRNRRLIDWHVGVLHKLLKQIVARRTFSTKTRDTRSATRYSIDGLGDANADSSSSPPEGRTASGERRGVSIPLDEVKEVISMPEFNQRATISQKDIESIIIPDCVLEQLYTFVATVAQMYRDNPFHNFNHASHVVMAVTKFMNRINEARELESTNDSKFLPEKLQASARHVHTYGIASDPLTQFACVFAALIHDVDHPGVPNPQLIQENELLAQLYRRRSVAEQNSFDLSWELFIGPIFKDLRASIGATPQELQRFRQIVINSVMATDLGDKELKDLRNNRWAKAFDVGSAVSTTADPDDRSIKDNINRKATIVIEHLIQAADVSHTTQHWEVYRTWNENLFRELYKAFRDGRAEKNPADFWYEGEIGFFDFYVIPLSKKLRDCGVFGLTSDENLNYAKQNRQQWVEKGVDIVEEMLRKAVSEYGSSYQ